MESDIIALEARAAVHEILILQCIGEIYRSGADGGERVRRMMMATESMLAKAAREATETERPIANTAREYFRQLSMKFLGALPHHGKH